MSIMTMLYQSRDRQRRWSRERRHHLLQPHLWPAIAGRGASCVSQKLHPYAPFIVRQYAHITFSREQSLERVGGGGGGEGGGGGGKEGGQLANK